MPEVQVTCSFIRSFIHVVNKDLLNATLCQTLCTGDAAMNKSVPCLHGVSFVEGANR